MRRENAHGWVRGATAAAVLAASLTAFGQGAPKGTAGAAGAKGAPAAGAPAAADPVVAQVVKLFDEGQAFADKKQWAKAADKMGQAYALRSWPQIAGGLGEAEVALGRYRDGAEHLEKFLREGKDIVPEYRKSAEGWLANARKNVATLTIVVSPPAGAEGAGAVRVPEVLIDDKKVELAPLPPEVFVEPGKHTVVARVGTARDEVTDQYEKGTKREVKLSPKKAPVGPVATGSAVATGSGSMPDSPQTRFPARTVAIIGGGAVAALGLGLGAAGLTLAGSKKAERDVICTAETCLHSGMAGYDEQKTAWHKLDSERVTLWNAGIAGFVVAGVGVAATGAVLFAWKPSPSKSAVGQSVAVVPMGVGAAVRANW